MGTRRRADDHVTFPTGYDAYGMATGQVAIAVPRSRDPMVPATTATPYLATRVSTEYARRDDAENYRVARTTTLEVVNDGRLTAAAFRDAIVAGRE